MDTFGEPLFCLPQFSILEQDKLWVIEFKGTSDLVWATLTGLGNTGSIQAVKGLGFKSHPQRFVFQFTA